MQSHILSIVLFTPLAGLLVLLGWATTARYVFGQPLTWSDEMATVLFVWLSMLGSVVALRREGHMRLTAFIRGMSPEWRARPRRRARRRAAFPV